MSPCLCKKKQQSAISSHPICILQYCIGRSNQCKEMTSGSAPGTLTSLVMAGSAVLGSLVHSSSINLAFLFLRTMNYSDNNTLVITTNLNSNTFKAQSTFQPGEAANSLHLPATETAEQQQFLSSSSLASKQELTQKTFCQQGQTHKFQSNSSPHKHEHVSQRQEHKQTKTIVLSAKSQVRLLFSPRKLYPYPH